MAPRAPRKRTGNRLIDSLPSREIEQLESQWQVISLKLTEEICRQDRPLSHVHFPVSGIYSTVIRMADGRVVEASTVGKEGMIGLSAVLGLTFSHKTATTPVPGDCLRPRGAIATATLANRKRPGCIVAPLRGLCPAKCLPGRSLQLGALGPGAYLSVVAYER